MNNEWLAVSSHTARAARTVVPTGTLQFSRILVHHDMLSVWWPVSDSMAGRQTPLLGCDCHLSTGQLLPAVCNRLRRCCCRVGRHPQGREIQRTGRPVHLPAHCCAVSSTLLAPWTAMPASFLANVRLTIFHVLREWWQETRFCFSAFLFCHFTLVLFCCTTVLSWTIARSISLPIRSYLFQFPHPRFFTAAAAAVVVVCMLFLLLLCYICACHTSIVNMSGQHFSSYWPHWQPCMYIFYFYFSVVILWRINMMMINIFIQHEW